VSHGLFLTFGLSLQAYGAPVNACNGLR
jgi:hypothetical protein